ncbi:MAG: pentapeptide repeat-containing protein, partial [Planctomycetes bacterium]|nr:pentapeptide repeat-containing protein [Planctomycetota bacterium]
DRKHGQRANLRAVDLAGFSFAGMDLRRVNMRRAVLEGVDLGGADLRRANLIGANLKRARLEKADLSDARLNGANLAAANLKEADLSRADMEFSFLVAAALGLGYGIDLPTVVRGLESVELVPGRLERIECGQPFSVFVDYAHTADALAGTLTALRQVTDGRLICLFGAGGDRDRQKRPAMARAAEAGADLTVVTSDNPRGEDPHAIIDDIVRGFEQPENIEVVPDRAEAIGLALSTAREGDCVLIAGKGHEDYQEIGGVRHYFDDREVARHLRYELAATAECAATR